MTATRRLGLAGLALLSLGATAAYYATIMTFRGLGFPRGAWNSIVLGAVAAMTALVLIAFWRSVNRSVRGVAQQIKQMADTSEIGLVMSNGIEELNEITRPLNRLLTGCKDQIDQLRAGNRELQIQSRIAAAEKSHAEAIIFSISDAVIVTNKFDELILANQGAEKLLGFKLDGALRKNIDQVVADTTLVRLIRETRNHAGSFTRKVVEHTIDRKGSPRVFSIILSCVETKNEEVSGVVAVLHDVTREKEIARMKTDFVSSVSHELKTPLASIKAYVEMLTDEEAEDEQTRKQFLEIIDGETVRLQRLIENILNISRIESGVVRIVREPLNVSSVVRQVVEVARGQARAKNVELLEDLAPGFSQVEGDRDMLFQAVMNLISNAIKYTSEGGKVTVTVRLNERRKMIVCDVADTGVGISSEELPHIFDKFYRVRGSRKLAKGTGLGLALVKHVIETVHEGKLSVTSEEGAGSTFSFELPVLR